MSSSEIDKANSRIKEFLTPDEELEWLDVFEFNAPKKRIRHAIITVVLVVGYVIALPYVLLQFVSSGDLESRVSQLTFVGVLTFGLLLMTQIVETRRLIALTNRRLIITNLEAPKGDNKEPFLWMLYGEDIGAIEKRSGSGDRFLRIILKPGRKHFNYIREIDLNGIAPSSIDDVAEKIERYQTTVSTPEEERLDKPGKLTAAKALKSASEGVKKQHSAGELVIISLVLIGVFCFAVKDRIESRNWPSTTASISYSTIKSEHPIEDIVQGDFSDKYCFDRIVTYNVGNDQYSDTKEQALTFDSRVEAQVAQKPSMAVIYYSPEKPSRFTLDREGDFAKSMVVLFIAMALLIAASMLKLINPRNVFVRVVLTWSLAIGFSIIAWNVYLKLEPQLSQVAGHW